MIWGHCIPEGCVFPLPRGIHHSYPRADSCRHGRRLWGCLVGVEPAGGLWVMGSEVQLGPLGLGAGSWGPDGGRRLIRTAWGSNQRAQGLLAALRVCLPGTASCWHLLGTPTVGCGVRLVIFGVQVTRGEVQLGALQVRMVEGRSAWQLLGAERWAQGRPGASWGPADEHEPHPAHSRGHSGPPRPPSGCPQPPRSPRLLRPLSAAARSVEAPPPAAPSTRRGRGEERARAAAAAAAVGECPRGAALRDPAGPHLPRASRAAAGPGGGRRDWGMLGEGRDPRSAGGCPDRGLRVGRCWNRAPELGTGGGSASQRGSGPGALSLCHPSSPLKAR